MLVFDFLTAGSSPAALAVAAAGAAGVAATDFAGAAGAAVVAAAGAGLGATVVWAFATNPDVANSAKMREFFSMCVLQKHGNKATRV